ncbi:succinoglycan biosynthesis protein ExoO [Paraburkholderia sp. GAS448]|uniref:glycosyltransferase family 2 protein n=1 Tax=Paraburkholderia sp. GAS448 TaxID=3035136 RepID=UPI003D24C0AF
MDISSDRPVVSIIMANFNGAHWLREAIRSIQMQTLKNWELIIADDASTDESLNIIGDAVASDHRIKVLPADRNQGPSAARNRALQHASGYWLTIIDSDDTIEPSRLNLLVEAANSYSLAIVADDLISIDESLPGVRSTLLGLNAMKYIDTVEFVKNGIKLGYLKPMIRADCVAEIRYDERLRAGEDFDFLLRAIFSVGHMAIFPAMGYNYRIHRGSVSRSTESARQKIADMIEADVRFCESHKIGKALLNACNRRRELLKTRIHWLDLKGELRQRRFISVFYNLIAHPRVVFPATYSLWWRLVGMRIKQAAGR